MSISIGEQEKKNSYLYRRSIEGILGILQAATTILFLVNNNAYHP
jgi:hypothetical protein